jgi:two-component system CheB/CheR fusion protein
MRYTAAMTTRADARNSRTRNALGRRSRKPGLAGAEKAQQKELAFPIVGIGASAGGVEAFMKLVAHLPEDSGMAFVLVPHLAAAHKSELPQVLSRESAIPINEARHNQTVRPNRIYVLPPNKHMVMDKGRLRLLPRGNPSGTPRSIDIFFESLALEHRQRAIGVILSGTANDGTLGLEAIKGEGGFTFAQDSSARYDSMPRNAIAAGCVDLVLPPEAIARELARMSRHPYFSGESLESTEKERETVVEEAEERTPLLSGGHGRPPTGGAQAKAEALKAEEPGAQSNRFKPIITLLRNHSGVDFALYKSNTIQRRITRRMVLNKCSSIEDYAAALKRNAKELEALYSDVLISVTSFFRNPELFDYLKRKVFPRFFAEGHRKDPVRAWVLGCSTGQEAYSLAMVLEEFFEKETGKPKIQIFASDLNESLLAKARLGLYTKSLVQDISPERLRRFFVEEDGGYRVRKSLRDSVVFARQNLIHDPPFSRMDIVSCRNVLIYLDGAVHRKALPTFHYALKPSGILILGSSESIGPFTELFEPLDKKHRVYCKKPASIPMVDVGFSIKPWSDRKVEPPRQPMAGPVFHPQINIQREADRVALNRYVPPSVLINPELQVLHFRGDTSAYLKPPSGRPSFNLLHMVKPGLLSPVRMLVKEALKQNKALRKSELRWTEGGQSRLTSIEVVPLMNLKERCYLLFFEDASHPPLSSFQQPEAAPERVVGPAGKAGELRNRVVQLERELAESRDYLQSIQEQYEAVNEELQASNEETTSANEELQSTNEELETSKEELESTNEELSTVNEELANRNLELIQSNGDLQNLYANINMAVVLLSRDLTIRRFTSPAAKLFNLIDSDIGRSIAAIKPNLQMPDLETALTEVVESVSSHEREVKSKDGRWYVVRARPYFTLDRKVDGAVLLAIDIDQVKRSEEEAKTQRETAEAILHATPVPLLVLRSDLRVNLANEAFYKLFKTEPGETEGRLVYQLGNGQWNIPQFRNFLEEIVPRKSFIKDFEVTHDFPAIGRRTLFLNARRLDSQPGVAHRILISMDDYTDRLQTQEAVRASERRFRRLFETARDGILLVDPLTRKIKDSNPYIAELLEMGPEECLGKELWHIGLLPDEQLSHTFFRRLQEQRVVRMDNIQLRRPEERQVELIANLYTENGHEVIQCNIRDMTQRVQNEQAVLKAKEELAAVNRTLEGRVKERTASLEALNLHLRELSSRLITAQEDERQRMARELHDEVGSLVVALKLQLNAVEALLPPEERGKFQPLVSDLSQQIRQLSMELHPHVLDDLGLKAALQWHIKAFAQRTKIDVSFDSAATPLKRLPGKLEITIFRVVQEALTNVARHAETSSAEVRISSHKGEIRLEVRDRGKGFSMDGRRALPPSLGLTGMRERVLLMNGSFEVWSEPGKGTRVAVSLPIAGKKIEDA